MKKQRITRTLPALLLVVVMALSMAAPLWGTTAEAAAKYRLSRSRITLYVGDHETLELLLVPKKQVKRIAWTSSKKAVVTVSKGKLTAKKAGKATVTAKLSGKKYNCIVTVKKPKVTYVDKPTTVYVEQDPQAPETGNQTYQSDVTRDMTRASYWYKKLKTADQVLMTPAQIAAQNEKNFASADTHMTDLKSKDLSYDGNTMKENLANALMTEVRGDRIGTRKTIYVDGEALNESQMDSWFYGMKRNITNARTSAADTRAYGICVKRADMWMAPTNALVGWSATDADSEFIDSALNVNEPVLMDITTADGAYTHVTGVNCSGWVETDHFAVCDTREDWLGQWDVTDQDNVLVVTGSHITLEQSTRMPKTSALDLYLGTQLPMVPKEAAPAQIGERSSWYSYAVYVPTRDTKGKLEREVALISSHHDVSVGLCPMTQKNILTIAFSCLGDRYGWGGMLGAMDCSLYARNIYRCFGLEIPRNTTWQAAMPVQRTDLSEMDDASKAKAIRQYKPGSLLMLSGHITMYLGEDGGKLFVISDLGSLMETEETQATEVQSIYTVSINSLNVRRRSGNTWLRDMKWAICPFVQE